MAVRDGKTGGRLSVGCLSAPLFRVGDDGVASSFAQVGKKGQSSRQVVFEAKKNERGLFFSSKVIVTVGCIASGVRGPMLVFH